MAQNIIQFELHEVHKAVQWVHNQLGEHKTILLAGPLGSGKTTFLSDWLITQWGVTDVVQSPTYSIVNEYHTKNNGRIYHFDLYRIKNLQEAQDFGIEEYLYSPFPCFIEWPEMILPLVPLPSLLLTFGYVSEKSRSLAIKIMG